MTLIWPLLPFENGRLRKKNIRQYYSVCIVYTQFTRKRPFPPHIIIVCAHIQHEAVVFNRVARRTELHVYM